MQLETPFRSVRKCTFHRSGGHHVESFHQSPYVHLITAVAVTFGLALVLLTSHPQKAGFVEANNSMRGTPSRTAAPATLASDRMRPIRDTGTAGKSP